MSFILTFLRPDAFHDKLRPHVLHKQALHLSPQSLIMHTKSLNMHATSRISLSNEPYNQHTQALHLYPKSLIIHAKRRISLSNKLYICLKRALCSSQTSPIFCTKEPTTFVSKEPYDARKKPYILHKRAIHISHKGPIFY